MPLSPEDRDAVALHLVAGIGPRLTAALLDRFGSPSAILRASRAELLEIPYLGAKAAATLRKALDEPDVDAEIARVEAAGLRLVRLGGDGYPPILATIPTPPQMLYVKGSLLPTDERCVGLVGSRACTTYGRRIAEKIAHDLARAGWTVVSGLARGIDGEAHRGALRAAGRTLGILAGGLSRIYPPEHKELAEQVAAAGALVSEAPMLMEPMPGLFHGRNRIISGLSRAVVVIEAADKSGALITARHAAEQGREVFAVPGPVDSPASAGTLQLLRDGAKLVRGADDILEDLEGLPGPAAPAVPAAPPGLDATGQQIWDYLDERHTVDEVSRHLAQPVGDVARHLMGLELKRVIRRLPGNWYERA